MVGIATTSLGLALIVRIREEYDSIEEEDILHAEAVIARAEYDEHGSALRSRT